MKLHGGERLLRSEVRFLPLLKKLFLATYGMFIRVARFGDGILKNHRDNFIVAANHVTGSDSFVLQIALRRRLFMLAARRWFKSRFLGFFMTFFCDMVPVDAGKGTGNLVGMKRALALLRLGQNIGVYPSVPMSRDGKVHHIHNGAAYLSYRSGVPILPVFLKNLALGPARSRLALGEDTREGVGSLLHNLFNRNIEVHIGKPIYPRRGVDRRQEIKKINREMRRWFDEVSSRSS